MNDADARSAAISAMVGNLDLDGEPCARDRSAAVIEL